MSTARRMRNKCEEDVAGSIAMVTPIRQGYARDTKSWNANSQAESKSEEEEAPFHTYLSCSQDIDVDQIAPDTPFDLCDRKILIRTVGNDIEDTVATVHVSNFALGTRSPVFRRMLSVSSGFAESRKTDVVVHVQNDQTIAFEVMVRLLHLQSDDIVHHMNIIVWPKLLIQLILVCDRFRVMDLMTPILDTFQKLANTAKRVDGDGNPRALNSGEIFSSTGFGSLDAHPNDYDEFCTDEEETSPFDNHHESYCGFGDQQNVNNRTRKRPQFNGMGVDDLIEILNLRFPSIPFLQKIKKVTADAVCKRFSRIEFNRHGIVDETFLSLPAKVVKMILEQNQLRSWSENDVFLATMQWVNNDCCRHLSQGSDGIRFHCMDSWFLAEIVSRHPQIVGTPHLYDAVVDCLRVGSTNTKARTDLVGKFVEDKLNPRLTPGSNGYDTTSYSGYNGIAQAQFGQPTTIPRRVTEYDSFEVIFSRNSCLNLDVNGRVTSRYLVWRGITFAIDLVRKQSTERGGETVGVFLYCQGLVSTGKIMVKYGIQTVNHQHQLTCSDFKCMHLNFRRGNGSRDFFQCTWDSFLDTYFENSRLVLRVVFIAIE